MANILIAGPNLDEAELYAYALRFAGHQVTVSTREEEVFHLANTKQVDLILFDTSLLGNDTITIWQSLDPGQSIARIPVIYIIDRDPDAALEERLTSDKQEYIVKPISLDDLTKRVKRTLKRKRR